jgi:hypothetical protein
MILKESSVLKKMHLIIIRVVIIIILSKTNVEMMISTLQSFANLQRQKNAQREISADVLTTE